MKSTPYIIVQASGLGTRMRHLTNNRPKALISLNGEPFILRLMRLYSDTHFIVIGSYKFDVLDKYLKKYSPTDKLTLIESPGSTIGNNAGISQALDLIPANTPVMILWSDLYHKKPINFSRLEITKNNYIGLSKTFYCRWRFRNNKLEEKRSRSHGIAGVYVFMNKRQIIDVPDTGEFCEYLRKKNIKFVPFSLSGIIKEIGTLNKYTRAINATPISRPFNEIQLTKSKVAKIPRDKQGNELARIEAAWYKKFADKNWDFLPKILNYKPLTMGRINGLPLYRYRFSSKKKLLILTKIIENLQTIHNSQKPIRGNFYQNNHEIYLDKTRRRLDSVADIIPHINTKTLPINGEKVLNPYLNWRKIEKITIPLFTNTYVPIHGDLTFSNTLFEPHKNKVFLIDPRGYFGTTKIYGDPDYDWAKLYYSVIGNYDQFNRKRFKLKISDKEIRLNVDSNGYSQLKQDFFNITGADPNKIEILHGIIWLSLSSYAWDDYDSICGAFYNGAYLLRNAY